MSCSYSLIYRNLNWQLHNTFYGLRLLRIPLYYGDGLKFFLIPYIVEIIIIAIWINDVKVFFDGKKTFYRFLDNLVTLSTPCGLPNFALIFIISMELSDGFFPIFFWHNNQRTIEYPILEPIWVKTKVLKCFKCLRKQ